MLIRLLWSRTFVGSWVRRYWARTWRLIDHIPDGERLWRAVRADNLYRDGSVKPATFRDNRGGYSCDIAAFSSVERSRHGYADPAAWDADSAGLIEFTVGAVRGCTKQGAPSIDVTHVPLRTERVTNYSHAQFSRKLSHDEEKAIADKKNVRVVVKPRKV